MASLLRDARPLLARARFASPPLDRLARGLLFDWSYFPLLAALLLAAESALCAILILKARYTPIDWRAYMQEVEGPLVHGVWDYAELRGETGPLVYPGGFVWLFAGLRFVAGGDGSDVRAAQCAFAAAYVATHALVFAVYARARPAGMPPWVAVLLCASKRLHSLYALRLFNDCWAILLLYAAVLAFSHRRWAAGCALYSLGAGVKANLLLSAPALLLLLLKVGGPRFAASRVALCAAIQLALGWPFLRANPRAYIIGAFGGFGDLKHKWTVNWKFLPPELFLSKGFALPLLALHLLVLGALAARRWCAAEGGLARAWRGSARPLHAEHIVGLLLTCNFVGVAFWRSLHFQFYTWYFHAMPLLLWRAPLPTSARLAVLAALEFSFSYWLDPVEGTSTPLSSAVLQLAHAVALAGLWRAPPGRTFEGEKAS